MIGKSNKYITFAVVLTSALWAGGVNYVIIV